MTVGRDIRSKLPESVQVWDYSSIMEDVEVGEATKIGRHVHVGRGTRIGSYCKIQNGAQIFGATLGTGVLVGPYAVLVEDPHPRAVDFTELGAIVAKDVFARLPVVVGDYATIGASAVIKPGVRIGKFAMIGIGAVVLTDIPDYGLALGNPARLLGRVCKCGLREIECRQCGDLWAAESGRL